ncbi:hypothetical protein B296_00037340 [Ensete ventricosum]|uniref:Uncharacterized protein n=1 Tax=Ensete ventricosum TaxID=4639 RepID=A0A426Z8P2_ENSVE|nr:hypothetical protein B296_00037340 [Ensete ventricosum]
MRIAYYRVISPGSDCFRSLPREIDRISRGREKEEEGEEKPGVLFVRTMSPAGDFFVGGRFLLPARGEETSPRVGRRNEAT